MQRLSLNERGRRNEISAMHVDGIGGVSAALKAFSAAGCCDTAILVVLVHVIALTGGGDQVTDKSESSLLLLYNAKLTWPLFFMNVG
jgi:hypothetical protein